MLCSSKRPSSRGRFKTGGLQFPILGVLKRPRLDPSIHGLVLQPIQRPYQPPWGLRSSSPNPSGSLSPTFIVDLPISVNISFPDHFVHFFIRQLLAEVRHHVAQLGGADVAVPVLEEEKLPSGGGRGQGPGWQRSRSTRLPSIASLPNSRAPIPGFTLSNTRKASRISSSLSVSFIFLAIMVRNSGKSMVPLPERQQWAR